MIGPLLVGGGLFFAAILAGCVIGGWQTYMRRRHLRQAFARGRAERLTRVPMVVEPLPTFEERLLSGADFDPYNIEGRTR